MLPEAEPPPEPGPPPPFGVPPLELVCPAYELGIVKLANVVLPLLSVTVELALTVPDVEI